MPSRFCHLVRTSVRFSRPTGRTVVVFKDGEIVWEKTGREYLPQGRSIDGDETWRRVRTIWAPRGAARLMARGVRGEEHWTAIGVDRPDTDVSAIASLTLAVSR